jgi:hypothetical protein
VSRARREPGSGRLDIGTFRGDDLTARVAGQSVMAACLAEQDAAPPRSRLARVFGADPIAPAAVPWFHGALGERTTASYLDTLGPEWIVLHSVPVAERGTDIDHLLVGPAGVVTVNTKRRRDARVWIGGDVVMVSGRREPFVPAARSELRRVHGALAALTLPVAPVTTFVAVEGAASVTVRTAPADVRVVDARLLVRSIRRLPAVLDHDAVWSLAGALASSVTWTNALAPDDGHVVERFAALERRVNTARAVRLGWAGAFLAGVVAVLVPAAASLLP